MYRRLSERAAIPGYASCTCEWGEEGENTTKWFKNVSNNNNNPVLKKKKVSRNLFKTIWWRGGVFEDSSENPRVRLVLGISRRIRRVSYCAFLGLPIKVSRVAFGLLYRHNNGLPATPLFGLIGIKLQRLPW